jgi:hypothetical protein
VGRGVFGEGYDPSEKLLIGCLPVGFSYNCLVGNKFHAPLSSKSKNGEFTNYKEKQGVVQYNLG